MLLLLRVNSGSSDGSSRIESASKLEPEPTKFAFAICSRGDRESTTTTAASNCEQAGRRQAAAAAAAVALVSRLKTQEAANVVWRRTESSALPQAKQRAPFDALFSLPVCLYVRISTLSCLPQASARRRFPLTFFPQHRTIALYWCNSSAKLLAHPLVACCWQSCVNRAARAAAAAVITASHGAFSHYLLLLLLSATDFSQSLQLSYLPKQLITGSSNIYIIHINLHPTIWTN